MIHFLVAFGLLGHVLWWGAGAGMLAMPRPWIRFWPVLVPPAAFALQSAVVWVGAQANLRGTLSYAGWSELIPIGLAWLGLRRRGWRAARVDLERFGLVWAVMAACLVLLVLPVALASRSLTTLSLGSCDAADYAAGARVLLEFARTDREGLLGLVEVVRVASVDNFFDYWLRLNHFTPSALIAFNGAILGCAPHELTSLFVAVLLAATVPLAFWSARAIVGYSGGVSLLIAGLFGVSPIMWYAVGHVAPGQLLAAQAVVLLTWAGSALWRGRLSRRRAAAFGLVLGIGYWLVLGSYNFFLLVCLVPAVAQAGGAAVRTRAWGRWLRWGGWMLLPLAACAGLFYGRVAGLAERFTLLQTYDFGWRIPALTAEGWLGMVAGPDLGAWERFGLRWGLSAGVIGLLGWALLRGALQRRRGVWTVLAIALPVLAGYVFLQARGARLGTNASYDAYKLFAVFFPLLLPAFCWWVTLRRSRRLHEWLFVCAVAAVVAGFNLVACGQFIWALSRPPLIVGGELRDLRRVEAMADVRSVNLMIPDLWSRLWAHVFLLRTPQYFPLHSYEGRLNTPLRGDWDLDGGVARTRLAGDAFRPVTRRFSLVDTRHPAFVRVRIEDGGDHWHAEEQPPGGTERWRWTAGDALVRVENPQAYPLTIAGELEGWSPLARHVTWRRDGDAAPPPVRLQQERTRVSLPAVVIPPGGSTFRLQLDPAAAPVAGDPRPLGLCVFQLTLSPRR